MTIIRTDRPISAAALEEANFRANYIEDLMNRLGVHLRWIQKQDDEPHAAIEARGIVGGQQLIVRLEVKAQAPPADEKPAPGAPAH